MLTERTYRANVERVRDAMTALPEPAYGVTFLEALAVERTPVVAGIAA
jgi:hypothetical protein